MLTSSLAGAWSLVSGPLRLKTRLRVNRVSVFGATQPHTFVATAGLDNEGGWIRLTDTLRRPLHVIAFRLRHKPSKVVDLRVETCHPKVVAIALKE